ncbi:rRNA-processing protein FCF1 -like protein, partial [Trichinella spiralis]
LIRFRFHRFMYGACRSQVHDLGQRKFGHPLSRDNHRPPVWRLLFSSMLPARIPAAAVAQCPLSISDDPWNHPRMPGMASLTCIAFVGIFAGSLHFQHKNPSIRELKKKKAASKNDNPEVRELPRKSAALFLQYNEHLGPPYHVILDTNFINFSIKNKLDIVKSMTDCLYAKCVPYITDCVLGELEKMGTKFKLALRVIKDPRFERLVCLHKGTYADDCIVQRVTEAKCYIVATCDKDLKRRIRKIPGVPIMYITNHRYSIERLPDAYGAPKN